MSPYLCGLPVEQQDRDFRLDSRRRACGPGSKRSVAGLRLALAECAEEETLVPLVGCVWEMNLVVLRGKKKGQRSQFLALSRVVYIA